MYPFQQRIHLSPDLLWVRSFHELYNPEMAIRVLHRLTEQYPESTLTMVGPDKDGSLQKCKDLVQELGLGKQISFTGMMPKAEWIKLSATKSVFINTTNFDNLPVSVIEAMALGMPVISTNVGGIPYLINDGMDGLLVGVGDEDSMYNAILELFGNSAKTAAISMAARQKAEQYNWTQIKSKWNNLLLAQE
jgi:glycosyltransferase involved in cell wall biosynthesis